MKNTILILCTIFFLCTSCEETVNKSECSCEWGKSTEIFEDRGNVRVHGYMVDRLDHLKPVKLVTINKNLVSGLAYDCVYLGQQGNIVEYIIDDTIIGYWE